MKPLHLVLTCEHAGNELPSNIKIPASVLSSHRGYDSGAYELSLYFKNYFKLPLFYQMLSRLVIEMNRSLNHPKLFSEFTKGLSKETKNDLIETFYNPYRDKVEQVIKKELPVLHLSIHTFTPVFEGIERTASIGLLYDSRRSLEKSFCGLWKQKLKNNLNLKYKTKMNYPYLGKADGLTSYLRKKFKPKDYLGIELEVSNGLFKKPEEFDDIAVVLAETLKECLTEWEKKCLTSIANPQIPPAVRPA